MSKEKEITYHYLIKKGEIDSDLFLKTSDALEKMSWEHYAVVDIKRWFRKPIYLFFFRKPRPTK